MDPVTVLAAGLLFVVVASFSTLGRLLRSGRGHPDIRMIVLGIIGFGMFFVGAERKMMDDAERQPAKPVLVQKVPEPPAHASE